MRNRNVLLLDADQFCYRCCFAAEQPIQWDSHTVTKTMDMDIFKQSLDSMIETAKQETGLTNVHFGLSSDVNFRKALWPEYKANRDPRKKPVGLNHALDYIRANFPTHSIHGLEADDVLGILAHRWKSSILWANDKDFLTVPMTLCRKGEVIHISEEDANKQLMIQTITGDVTDNFKGIEGFGPVKAMRYLEGTDYSWTNVIRLFNEHDYSVRYAITMAKLARICRVKSDATSWFPTGYNAKSFAALPAEMLINSDF